MKILRVGGKSLRVVEKGDFIQSNDLALVEGEVEVADSTKEAIEQIESSLLVSRSVTKEKVEVFEDMNEEEDEIPNIADGQGVVVEEEGIVEKEGVVVEEEGVVVEEELEATMDEEVVNMQVDDVKIEEVELPDFSEQDLPPKQTLDDPEESPKGPPVEDPLEEPPLPPDGDKFGFEIDEQELEEVKPEEVNQLDVPSFLDDLVGHKVENMDDEHPDISGLLMGDEEEEDENLMPELEGFISQINKEKEIKVS